jgi:DNA-binding response OmpR family regulator
MIMNVLYITGDLSDADFVEHELGKIAPYIHIDVSPRNADALTRISAAGKYDAVLLDPLLPGGENLIACIREQMMPLAVIVMTGVTDGTPPLEMLRTGADDYIVKRPHFVDVLPLILQRVIARRQSGENRDVAPAPGRPAEADRARIEKEQDPLRAQWLEERAKYEEERVLLQDAARVSEAKSTAADEQHRIEKEEWQAVRQEMEWQRLALEEALRAAELEKSQLAEQSRKERAEWETARLELESQLRELEGRRASLAEVLHDLETRLAELDELRRTESAALDSERRKLAQRQRELGETLGILVKALEASEAYQAQLLEERRLETERQSATRRALEEVLRVASGERQSEPLHELVAAAMNAFVDLTGPVIDCGALLMEFLDPDDPRRERARLLMEVARRAGDLAVRLLARGASQEFIDLNLCVSEILGNLRSMAGERVDLLTILSPTLPHVQATRPRTKRLLQAVLQTARDTLPLGGTIILETAVRGYDGVSEPRSGVLLSVTASGNGAHADVDTVPLEPLVCACGGKLSISGDSEIGTSVEIILPMLQTGKHQ